MKDSLRVLSRISLMALAAPSSHAVRMAVLTGDC